MTRGSTASDSRGRRWTVVTVGVLGLLLVLFLLAFDWNWLRGPVEQRLQQAVGRDVSIGGDFDVQLGWPTTLIATRVRIANAEWAEPPEMLIAERVEARIRPLDALLGRWHFPRLTLHQALAYMQWNQRGDFNWSIAGDDGGDAVELDRLLVNEGKLVLDAHSSDVHLRLAVDSEQRHARQGTAPMRIGGHGRVRGQPITVAGRVDSLLALTEAGRGYQIDLAGTSGTSRIEAIGTLSASRPTEAFDLQLRLAGQSTDELGKLIGAPLPDSPEYRLTGALVRNGDVWRGSSIDGTFGEHQVGGNLAVDLRGSRPFASGALHATVASAGHDGGGMRSPLGRNMMERLGDIDADLQLSLVFAGASQQESGDGLLRSAHTVLELRDRAGRADPIVLGLAGGRINGAVRFDAVREPLRLDVSARLRSLQLERLLPEAFDAAADGRIGGELKLVGSGSSIEEFVASTRGDIELLMGRTTVQARGQKDGIEGAGLIGFEGLGADSIAIRCAYADLEVSGGEVTTRTLAIDSDDTLIVGEGGVDLAERRWDLVLHPRPKDPGLSLQAPVHVKGPLMAPEFDPDTGQMLGRGLAAGALAAITPPAALIALADPGTGEDLDCDGLEAHGQLAAAEGGGE